MWNVVESAVGVVSSRFVSFVWWPQRHLNVATKFAIANFRALRTYPSTCLPVRRLEKREKSVGTRWGRVEFMASSTRKSPVVTVQADLRRRVAEVTDVLDAGLDRIRRLARRCSDAVTSVSSVVASPDARAKIALDQFMAQIQHTGRQICIRIIHGKGYGSKDGFPVIKRQTQQWLQCNISVLAYCSCRPSDGGTGAIYVLVKSIT